MTDFPPLVMSDVHTPVAVWKTTRFELSVGARTLLMGVVNCTPDSFSDGGSYAAPEAALAQCEALLAQGADILDIGAESSRPGAQPLPQDVEWTRLLPVLREAVQWGVPISVDSYQPETMRRALDMGVDIINDIHALQNPQSAAVVQKHGACGVVLMHMQGNPANMQHAPMVGDVLTQIEAFFNRCVADFGIDTGVHSSRWCIDPGIGFGKTPEQNIAITKNLARFRQWGLPVLMGWSRKSTLGHITGLPVEERLIPSVAAAIAASAGGAQILRVHDVAATKAALAVWRELAPNS